MDLRERTSLVQYTEIYGKVCENMDTVPESFYEKYGVKKSILYNMQLEPCSQEVAKQLAEDFNVELEKIND